MPTQSTIDPTDLALKYIRDTGYNIFLTGKAGTGKTTFLRNLKTLAPKRMVVVAPTGVAAINAGGVTAHSFFQLPLGPYLPAADNRNDTEKRTRPAGFNFRFSREKINIIRTMDLLVIDEVSMVRADLLDAISDVLRRFRDRTKPFGGVQLLLIGDLRQLAPVAKEEEWALLKEHYRSPYFFDSHALTDSRYLCVELTHVYRQSDLRFLDLLNKIRDNSLATDSLRQLNERYIPNFQPNDEEGYITLTTHNYQAQSINRQKLQVLPGEPFTFKAGITGDFPSYSYPTDPELELKAGAQVMFVKNDSSSDKRYFNGKIGHVLSVDAKKIVVRGEDGQHIPVHRELWQNVKYTIDEETQAVRETPIGSFEQYPLKTAWAITIHKSQGLTFERAIIDAAQSFSHGQVYVALSRCRTLEGLVLNRPLTSAALVNDTRVEQYTHSLLAMQAVPDALPDAAQQYYLHLLTELFDFEDIRHRLNYAAPLLHTHLSIHRPDLNAPVTTVNENFRADVVEVAQRFRQQLTRMVAESPDYAQDDLLNERIAKGAAYFSTRISTLITLFSALPTNIGTKETRTLLRKATDKLHDALLLKAGTLRSAAVRFTPATHLAAKAAADKPNKKADTF